MSGFAAAGAEAGRPVCRGAGLPCLGATRRGIAGTDEPVEQAACLGTRRWRRLGRAARVQRIRRGIHRLRQAIRAILPLMGLATLLVALLHARR
ncbi:hypothetical protein [Burkholderia gladioli]|uniref:hypothetical protein n=1 Tax=Burkholderia gladioli TaxID=28095 RepID=UPI001640AA49|nr:hypothetical protein [Burkholderia gladioli]